MVKVSNEPLQPNPFTTHRDPNTGLWVVVKAMPKGARYPNLEGEKNFQPDDRELLLSQSEKAQS
jgi:hypothetical protein